MAKESTRAGRYISQTEGYRAFVPASLPPSPAVKVDEEMTRLLSDADRALGRLDGVASVLPNPDLFVAMYVRQEAVLSSQIEGTQSTLEDVLKFEVQGPGQERVKDVYEVVNYIAAMNHGIDRLPKLPLSLRLIREIHEKLLSGVRGGERTPGEFRRSQNWIGPAGCTLNTASFIPPPPHELNNALGDLEKFLHDRESLPVLIHCALAHAQFETIHPFLDGNGRVGRLLITLLLCERTVLAKPLLYLSYYLKAHRAEYYDRLTAIRTSGDWEGWVKFFLRGVYEVSLGATDTARLILSKHRQDRDLIARKLKHSATALRLLETLYHTPITTVKIAKEALKCSYVTAARAIEELQKLKILTLENDSKRNRRYRYSGYLKLFERQALRQGSGTATN